MLIRCEKCSTLYELDEKLLPPQGAPVQCSKCQFVFKAYPAPAAGQQAVPPPPPPDVARGDGGGLVREGGALAGSPSPRTSVSRPQGAGSGGTPVPGTIPGAGIRTPLPPGDGEQQFTADGRPIRKVPFPSSVDASTGGAPRPVLITSSGRASGPAAGALGRVAVVVVVLAILVAVAIAGWRYFGHRGERARPAGQGALDPAQRPDPAAGGKPSALARK